MSYQTYYLEKDKAQPLFLLFHGTGGNERDLVEVAEFLAPKSSILSIRGNVDENGNLRYFRRLGLGLPDIDDLEQRSKELLIFIKKEINNLEYSSYRLIVLGYSNGANIITAMNQQESELFDWILLAHGRKYLEKPILSQKDKNVFITLGENDKMIDPERTMEMAFEYKMAGAKVSIFSHDNGHRFDQGEVLAMRDWMKEKGVE